MVYGLVFYKLLNELNLLMQMHHDYIKSGIKTSFANDCQNKQWNKKQDKKKFFHYLPNRKLTARLTLKWVAFEIGEVVFGNTTGGLPSA